VIEREGEHLVWGDPGAVLVHDAEAIRIAIQAETDAGFAAADEIADGVHAISIRFGVMAAEERVPFVVETGHLRAGLFQQGIEIATARAIHQLYRDFHLGLLDGLEVDELLDLLEVSGQGIDGLALEGADDGGLERPVLGLQLRDDGLDLLGDFGRSGSAIAWGKLEALIFRRVMAGGWLSDCGWCGR
jgi:hypothetical protein